MAKRPVDRYASAVNNAALLAQRDVAKVFSRVRGMPPGRARNALLATVPGIVERYSRMAVLAAAQYVEAERRRGGGAAVWDAGLAETAGTEQVKASVRFAAGHLEWGEASGEEPEPYRSLFAGRGREGG